MHITVDRSRCCGYGTCVVVAPELFDLSDEDALAYPLLAEPGPEHYSASQRAADACPANAIVLAE